jgi:hypothetical protein
MLKTCLLALVAGALLLGSLTVAFALALRRSIGRSAPPRLNAVIATSPPRLELTVALAPEAPAIRVERISLPRIVADSLGALPPPGWRLVADPPPDRGTFEADLEELADSSRVPTDAQIEAETDRQFREYTEAIEHRQLDTVTFEGHLTVLAGRSATLVVQLAELAPVHGSWSILYSQRAALWRFTSGASAALPAGP